MIKCPNCSAELNYDVSNQEVVCSYCGSKFNPEKLDAKVTISKKDTYEGKSYTCSQCGATLLTFDDTAITFCSYCGSQAMIESEMIKNEYPEYIIPFKVSKEKCIKKYKNKMRWAFFAPSYMKKNIVVSKFRGIFIPYAIYKCSFHKVFHERGSRYKKRRGDYVYYNDYGLSGQVDADYEGFAFDLSSKFYDKYSFSIPFDFNKALKFNPNYLIGFYADSNDVNACHYDFFAKETSRTSSNKKVGRNYTMRRYGCYHPDLHGWSTTNKIGMFPVYFLAIRDKSQKYVSYAVVNGYSGKLTMDLPIDKIKYVFWSLILSVLIFFLINDKLVITPPMVLFFSIISSIISLVVSNNRINRITLNSTHQDDIGMVSKESPSRAEVLECNSLKPRKINSAAIIFSIVITLLVGFITIHSFLIVKETTIDMDFFGALPFFILMFLPILIGIIAIRKDNKVKFDYVKMPIKEKIKKYLYKQLIAISLCALVMFINPIYDFVFYGVSLIAFLFVISSFFDLIDEHNELIRHKLPQLEKRGGDENE